MLTHFFSLRPHQTLKYKRKTVNVSATSILLSMEDKTSHDTKLGGALFSLVIPGQAQL